MFDPLFWVELSLVFSVCFRKRRKLWIGVSLGLLFIFSNPTFTNYVMYKWEVHAVPIKDLEGEYDVAVIMGGFTDLSMEPNDRIYLNRSVDRMMHPLQLYRIGKVKHLLATGGNTEADSGNGSTESQTVITLLKYCGVPDSALLQENKSLNSRQNAVNTKALLEKLYAGKPAPRILLVTSGFHMRRARACFKAAGLRVTAYPTDFRSRATNGGFRLKPLIIPSAGAIDNWQLLFHEWAGYVSYKIMGYI